jgi:hypothetical protein
MNRVPTLSLRTPKSTFPKFRSFPIGSQQLGQRGYVTTAAFTLPTHPNKTYVHPTHVLPTPAPSITQEHLDRAKYILPVYARPEIVLSKAKGPYVWDVEGRRYLDFSAGIAVNALGGGDAGVIKVSFRFSSLFRRLSDEANILQAWEWLVTSVFFYLHS